MTKKEVLELFKLLTAVYPQFEVSQYKIDTWTNFLKDQSSTVVFANAKNHIRENKFAPSIAELREQKPDGRDIPRGFNYDVTAGEDDSWKH